MGPSARQPMVNFNDLLNEMNESDRDTGERLRRHLQFFFMNPFEKWKVRSLDHFLLEWLYCEEYIYFAMATEFMREI